MTRDRSIVFIFCALVAAFVAANAMRTSAGPDSTRWPVLRTVERPGAGGLRLIDVEATKSSVARLPVVRTLRQLGNSARVALGQRLDWVFFGNAAHPSMFPLADLWVARGTDGEAKGMVQAAASRMADYVAMLQREGWTVVMVLVPPKTSIYPDWLDWPVLAADPLTRQPVPSDRSAEVISAFAGELQRRGVPTIDLYPRYRAHRVADPGALLYPLGESHWSGLGLQIAAEDTADFIAKVTPIRRRFPRYAMLDVQNTPDLFRSFDVHPWFPGPLFPFASHGDRLVIGEVGQPYYRAEQKQALVAVVGTSFTGQYTWNIDKPVGFTSAINNLLEHTEVQNHSRAGGGSGESVLRFASDRAAITADFERRSALAPGSYPRVVVWEHPIRDIRVLPNLAVAPGVASRAALPPTAGPPAAAAGASATTPPPALTVLRADECAGCTGPVQASGLFGREQTGGTPFHWAGPNVTLQVTPQAPGSGRLVLRLLTPYVPTTLRLVVEVNDAPGREVAFTGCNFASPTRVSVPVSMRPGVNTVRLRFPLPARAVFPGDLREIAYGLAMPITISTR